jgi:hypothetical protein
MAEGQALLGLSPTGSELTEYHVGAAIASVHASAHRAEDTDLRSLCETKYGPREIKEKDELEVLPEFVEPFATPPTNRAS